MMHSRLLCLGIGLAAVAAVPADAAGKRPAVYGPTNPANRPTYTPPRGSQRTPGMKSVGSGYFYGPTGPVYSPNGGNYRPATVNSQTSGQGGSRRGQVLPPVVNRSGYGQGNVIGPGFGNGSQALPNRAVDLQNSNVQNEPLEDALSDVENAWLDGESQPLAKRFPSQAPIAIFSSGKYTEDIGSPSLVKSISEAVSAFETQTFTFNKPRYSDEGKKAFVSGKHIFKDGQGQQHRLYVSYGLELVDRRWQITEFGHGETVVTGHFGAPKRTGTAQRGAADNEQPFGPNGN